MAATKKVDVAVRQINSAIHLYFGGGDVLSIFSLAALSSQILRDLNKGNSGSLSGIITDVIEDDGARSGLFWKEFNSLAAAVKHGSNAAEVVDLEVINKRHGLEILFAIAEYMLLPENRERRVTNEMYVFSMYYVKRESLIKKGSPYLNLLDMIYRKFCIIHIYYLNFTQRNAALAVEYIVKLISLSVSSLMIYVSMKSVFAFLRSFFSLLLG